jgi:SAM-dependent methyltransferase
MNAPEFEFVEKPCAVCGSESRRHLGWRGGAAHHEGLGVRTEIVRCDDCTHLYPHPMPFPRAGVGELYTDTEEYFSAHEVEAKKGRCLKLMKMFEREVGHRGVFLDVGCGRGEMLWAARESGWDYQGLDSSPAHLQWGRDHLGVTGHLGTIEDAHFADASFDAVNMGGVIEHLYDPFATLKEIWRVLRPGGVFYFDAPNEDALYTRVGNFYLWAQGRDWVLNLAPTFPPYHVQGFNPFSLRQLLQRVGFRVTAFDIGGEISPATGKTSLRKRAEHRAAQLINWIGSRRGAGIYMYVWTRKPE